MCDKDYLLSHEKYMHEMHCESEKLDQASALIKKMATAVSLTLQGGFSLPLETGLVLNKIL
jgi:hypothetical protein